MEKVIVKNNNEIKEYNLEKSDVREAYRLMRENGNHLCSNCDKCRADNCLKVFDEVKRPLSEYEFITEGMQIYNKNGDIQTFYITKCNDYVKDRERVKPSTLDEINALKRIHESIKIAYFDAETIDEANQVQFDLFRRGQLTPYSGEAKKKILK